MAAPCGGVGANRRKRRFVGRPAGSCSACGWKKTWNTQKTSQSMMKIDYLKTQLKKTERSFSTRTAKCVALKEEEFSLSSLPRRKYRRSRRRSWRRSAARRSACRREITRRKRRKQENEGVKWRRNRKRGSIGGWRKKMSSTWLFSRYRNPVCTVSILRARNLCSSSQPY